MDTASKAVDSNLKSWPSLLVTIDLQDSFGKAKALIETINSITELAEMLQSLTTSMQDIHTGMGMVDHEDKSWSRSMHSDRYIQMGMYLQLQELIAQRMKAVQEGESRSQAQELIILQQQHAIDVLREMVERLLQHTNNSRDRVVWSVSECAQLLQVQPQDLVDWLAVGLEWHSLPDCSEQQIPYTNLQRFIESDEGKVLLQAARPQNR